MKLFINEKYVEVVDAERFTQSEIYTMEITPDVPLSTIKLQGHVLLWGGTPAFMDALLTMMEVRKLKSLNSITFVTDTYQAVRDFVKSQFRIIKAGGGVVIRGDKVLLIERLGKWDLPKGKLEKGEKSLAGAVREVEEECNVRVVAEDKLCSTGHTYVQDGRRVIKKTTWYLMYCLDDRYMTPQVEENITDIRWMNREQWQQALQNSYRSIEEVFAVYEKQRLGLSVGD